MSKIVLKFAVNFFAGLLNSVKQGGIFFKKNPDFHFSEMEGIAGDFELRMLIPRHSIEPHLLFFDPTKFK